MARDKEFIEGLIEKKGVVRHGGKAPDDFARIIQGRRYASDNMEVVASYEYGFASDFRSFTEKLYRTGNGRFLLVGMGHGLSVWHYATPQGRTYGHAFIALDDDEARQWLELRDQQDALAAFFGEQFEDA